MSKTADLIKILGGILRPVFRICVRHSLVFQEILPVLKTIYVEVAAEELKKAGEKVNASRVSVMTGIHRKDATAILEAPLEVPTESTSLVSEIAGRWENDPRFCRKNGKPRVLTVGGDDDEFGELVRDRDRSINPGTVLFEMKRRGMLEQKGNRITLLSREELLAGEELRGLMLLSKDVGDLIEAVTENVGPKGPAYNLHIRTHFHSIYEEDESKLRGAIIRKGKSFHKQIRNLLSKSDSDVEDRPGKDAGAEVVVTAYSLIRRPKRSSVEEENA